MPKKIYGQKNVLTYNLKDVTEEQAKAKGKIFHKAWSEFEEERKAKNRKKLEKALDKRNKV